MVTPESAPIEPDDGQLRIDRSTNPPTYSMEGFSSWEGSVICTTRDGTVYDRGNPGGTWAWIEGTHDGNRWSGAVDEYMGPREWSFTRL